jgi:hypothetical protein
VQFPLDLGGGVSGSYGVSGGQLVSFFCFFSFFAFFDFFFFFLSLELDESELLEPDVPWTSPS